MTDETSCRSDEGITVGLVDSFITNLRLFKDRDLTSQSIQEALLDVADDPDFQYFLDALEDAKGNRTDEGIDRLLQLAGINEKKWIQKAINPEHEGDCTPMSKSTCTPRKKALARRFKKGGDLHND